jgi:outer membrane protein assembly factor BamB/protocatechuate 3,4-dioxygenase beta subunit
MNKKPVSTLLILILLSSMMISIFFGTLQVAWADTQSSDSNGDPNSWLMFHSDLSHTGNSTSTTPLTGAPLWTYPTRTLNYIVSSPAVANGTVYIGLNDGNVTALNATNGAFIWNYTTASSVYSSPAISDGIVYIGSNDGNIYALNTTTGNKIWNYSTGGQVWSSPAVSDGTVYVGSQSGYIFAFNATNGAKIWDYKAGPVALSSPAVANGKVYIGSTNGNITALDAASGIYVWNYTTWGQVWSSPAIDNGIAYVGSFEGNVYALNAATGSKLWNFTTGGMVYSSPAVANGIVYVGSSNTNVYALNAATGSKLWNFTTGSSIISSPAVANGNVYIGPDPTVSSVSKNIYALNTTTGIKTWSYPTSNGIISSPAVANSIIYVGSYDGNVYAFSSLGYLSTTTSVLCSPNPNLAGSAVTCNVSVSGSNPIGTVSWSSNSSTGTFSSPTTSLTSGSAITTYSDPTPGDVTITATYNGDSNNAPSSGDTILTLNGLVVSGYVLAANGTGVPNARVNISNNTWSRNYWTGTSGYYSLAVPAGTFNVAAYPPSGSNLLNYQEYSLVISSNLFHNITLQTGFVVSGYALAPNGIGIPNAEVYFANGPWFSNNTWSIDTFTNMSGYYSVIVPVGTYEMSVYNLPSGTDLLNYYESGIVVSSNMIHNVTLQSGFVVSGYVLAPNGTGVQYVGINLYNGTWSKSSSANASGYYSLAVPAGTYSVSAYNLPSESNLLNYQESGLVVSSNLVHNITLQAGLIVSGYVLDPNGTVVPNEAVNFYNSNYSTGTISNSSGYFSVVVPTGTYTISHYLSTEGNTVSYMMFGVVVSGNMVLNVTIPSGYLVSGYVLAPNGTGATNAHIQFYNETWSIYYTITNSSGYYSLTVPSGTFNVYTSPPYESNLLSQGVFGVVVSGNMVLNVTIPSGYIVSGYVLDRNGAGISNAQVYIYNNTWGNSYWTDVFGHFSLVTQAGPYTLGVIPPLAYLQSYSQSNFVVSRSFAINVTLSENRTISGYVLSPNGTGVSGVTINAYPVPSGTSKSTTTNSSGYYSLNITEGIHIFSFVPPSSATLLSYSEGYDLVNSNLVKNVTLSQGYLFSGYILSPSGTGISGTSITLSKTVATRTLWSASASTNGSGYYSLVAPLGTFNLFATPSVAGFSYYNETGVVVSGTTAKNITLSSGYRISGYVLDQNANPVASAYVYLFSTTGYRGAYTNSSGYYVMYVPAGTFNLLVNPSSAASLAYYVESGVNVSADLAKNVTLNRGFKISGYVSDQNGNPVGGSVSIPTGVGTYSISRSIDSSGFYSIYVPAGTCNFLVNPFVTTKWIPYNATFIVSSDLFFNVTLSQGYLVSGFILDQNGNPVIGATVSFSNSMLSRSFIANGSGYYMAYLPYGSFNLLAYSPFGYNLLSYGASGVVVSSNIVVNVTMSNPPTLSASMGTINQGQTSILTATTVSTGTSPYSYQWFEKAPGGSYVMVGTNSASFDFVTSSSTTTGSWSFILQVTDSTSAVVNSTEVTVTVDSTDAYLVVRGLDNGIYARIYNSTTNSWGDWIGLPGQTIDTPAVAVCNGELHIVVKGGDGVTMWHSYITLSNNSFSGWSVLSGATPSTACLTSNGTILTLVVRGLDNSIYYRTYNPISRTWSGWGALSSGATCDSPAAYQIGNTLHVVVRGYSPSDPYVNNTLWYSIVDMVTYAVSSWTQLPGTSDSAATLTGSQITGNLTLVVKGTGGGIYTNKHCSSGWLGWAGFSGSTIKTPAATVCGDCLHLVVMGGDGVTMWHGTEDQTTGTFSDWNILNGYTPSKPTLTS